MKGIWIFMLCWIITGAWAASEKSFHLKSPDGQLEINVTVGEKIAYTLTHKGQVLLDKSEAALCLDDAKGTAYGVNSHFARKRERKVSETIPSPFYRYPSFTADYNELTLQFKEPFAIVFRAYNEGAAYRFETSAKDSLVILNEVADFRFNQDYKSYMAYSTAREGGDPYAMAFQNLYEKATLSQQRTDKPAFLPITIDYANGQKLTLTESDLEGYPGMFVRSQGNQMRIQGEFAKYPSRLEYHPTRHMAQVKGRHDYMAKTAGKHSFPWRVMAVTAHDTEMPVNDLVYALASPNRIGDISWIKTGQVAWDWWNDWGIYGVDFKAGINTQTYKYYIDFASENGIPFIVLDEGWYNPKSGDMLTIVPEVDLAELVRYGKEKHVELMLWTVFNVLDEQLEAACQKYAEMGIRGFKVDFLDRDDQTGVEMVYRIADACARHHLTLDLHGIYKPTGLNRTYPNVINFESVFGMEEVKWSKVEKDMMQYDVEMPFIRMMAGPLDYTPGAMRNATKRDFKDVYYNPMSQGTRCHQMAVYIVHDSPLTMLADNPTIYRQEQECTDFLTSIPTVGFEETRVLQGELGSHIVTARRIGDRWIVGGLTNWTPREITLDFSFLGEGDYEVTLFQDGINADKQAADYKKVTFRTNRQGKRVITLAPGGGFAMSIKK
ncbi:MAG: glycoside hydrolase family 97 protein [Parabacteroides sp.]